MKRKIHIMGASGAGTTTIAKNVCETIGYSHFDSDHYFWIRTEPPFTTTRPQEDRQRMIIKDLMSSERWILSGSMVGWEEAPMITAFFELVVFVYVPADIRMGRLREREYIRYGENILPAGKMYEASKSFLEWAAEYDTGTQIGRNLQKHNHWLNTAVHCQILRITNISLDESVGAVIKAIEN